MARRWKVRTVRILRAQFHAQRLLSQVATVTAHQKQRGTNLSYKSIKYLCCRCEVTVFNTLEVVRQPRLFRSFPECGGGKGDRWIPRLHHLTTQAGWQTCRASAGNGLTL